MPTSPEAEATTLRIAIGSDHAGLQMRAAIREHLSAAGHEVDDRGTEGSASVDYPDFAAKVAAAVRDGDADLGVLVCGTGIGMSMAANRIKGVRAAVCTHELTARMTRAHNDANVLCLGERVIGIGTALAIVDAFVAAEFEGGRHARRVDKITALEDG